MGFVNFDSLVLDCGLQLSNVYLSVTPGPPEFPWTVAPVTFQWTYDAEGNRSYSRLVTVYVYTSKADRDAGFAPIQSSRVQLSAATDAANVLTAIYGDLRQYLFTNASTDDGADRLHILPT